MFTRFILFFTRCESFPRSRRDENRSAVDVPVNEHRKRKSNAEIGKLAHRVFLLLVPCCVLPTVSCSTEKSGTQSTEVSERSLHRAYKFTYDKSASQLTLVAQYRSNGPAGEPIQLVAPSRVLVQTPQGEIPLDPVAGDVTTGDVTGYHYRAQVKGPLRERYTFVWITPSEKQIYDTIEQPASVRIRNGAELATFDPNQDLSILLITGVIQRGEHISCNWNIERSSGVAKLFHPPTDDRCLLLKENLRNSTRVGLSVVRRYDEALPVDENRGGTKTIEYIVSLPQVLLASIW